MHESLWIGSSLVFQCARSCLGCCIRNEKGSTRIIDELLNDADMLSLIESGIRGGIATISHHHAKANNEYMGADFDPVKKSKFISYVYTNDLYGWVMSKQLPTSGFEWMTDDELEALKHLSCILEVDLDYRKIYTTFAMIILLLRNVLKVETKRN